MWKEVQQFDISRLILSEIEGNADSREQWETEMHFFHPLEDALTEEEAPSVTEMLKVYPMIMTAGGQSVCLVGTWSEC